jgi:hypothetical protein
LLKGTWNGEGFAKFPTIEDTAYTEICSFEPDEDKNIIRYEQKTWYKNKTPDNGKTVFWDTGFILLKGPDILLVSAQSGGRVETYRQTEYKDQRLIFDSIDIHNDDKTIRSQRIIHIYDTYLEYELNMSTHQAAEFQNHLKASLKKLALGNPIHKKNISYYEE